MNLRDIRAQVATIAAVSNTGADQILIDQWVNEAVREVSVRVGPYVKCDTMDLTSGKGDYELPAAILRLKALSTDDRQLEQVGPFDIEQLRLQYPDSTAAVHHYALNGANMLMFYPTPTAVVTVHVYYVPKPTELSAATDDPSSTALGGIPVEHHHLLVDYAASRMLDLTNPGLADRMMQRFDTGIVRQKTAQNLRGGKQLAPARYRRSRRPVSADPSADIY